MELNIGQWVVVGVCAFLILGYIRGYYYNRQRARQILFWLHEELTTLGSVSSGEKLPGMATGGRLEVKQAIAPLRRVEVVYLLAPRENLLFWLFHLLQGKHDELILWVTYQSKPEQDIEVARSGDRQFTNRIHDKDKKQLSVSDGPNGLLVASEKRKDGAQTGRVQFLLEKYGSVISRFALRGNKPHLFLRVDLRLMKLATAHEFFSDLRQLAT